MDKLKLPAESAISVKKMFSKLGATELSDFSGLEDSDISEIQELIPKLKKAKFMDELLRARKRFSADTNAVQVSQQRRQKAV